jgi:hypothetical protein
LTVLVHAQAERRAAIVAEAAVGRRSRALVRWLFSNLRCAWQVWLPVEGVPEMVADLAGALLPDDAV